MTSLQFFAKARDWWKSNRQIESGFGLAKNGHVMKRMREEWKTTENNNIEKKTIF